MSLIDDINNPLEQLKVEQALRSEYMKLEYRQKNRPDQVNILDYTVIAALDKQIQKKPIVKPTRGKLTKGCWTKILCPTCKEEIFSCFYYLPWNDAQERHQYCISCGQAIDWSVEE